jgi:putative FmdB family regulatory protein
MPIYTFVCQKCSHPFEVTLPFGSKKRPRCPRCGSAKTEKLIVPPAIHFKGSGFFKTDSQKSRPSATSLPTGETERGEKTTSEKGPAKKEMTEGAKVEKKKEA